MAAEPEESVVTGPVGESRERLVDERDHLLASIRDLDREFDFGDMDEGDYRRLKDQYTARAAEVLRRIEGEADAKSVGPTVESADDWSSDQPAGSQAKQSSSPASETASSSGARRGPRWRRYAAAAGVVILAALSGVMVARSAGQRGSNPITGSAGGLRDQLATCQPLSFQQPERGVDCYSRILAKAPENLEALTYQGWAYVRAGEIDKGGENFAKVVALDPTYSDVRVFRAVVAARAGDYDTAAKELDQFYRNKPSPMAVQVLQSQGLERQIFFGQLPVPVSECWQNAAKASKESKKLDANFYSTLGSCLDSVLAGSPEDVSALVSRAFAAAGSASVSNGSTIDAATPFLDKALTVMPDDANALMLRASLSAANGRTDAAKTDLERLQSLPRPTISFLTGGPEQVSAGL